MDTCLEEVTFNTFRTMLSCADRTDYINDDDEVLEQFDLNKLYGRLAKGIEYGEDIIDYREKNSVYDEAQRFLANDTFIPELDRIYAGSINYKVTGHPVHYMIQTDDGEIRKGMFGVLLQALYANKRILSKRYCFIDFRPGENFSSAIYDCLYKSNIGGTVIVRYLANDDTEEEFANCGRDTVEIICEVMKKYCNQVLTIFCLPRECTCTKDIFYENLGNISIVELKEEFVTGERAKDFMKLLAKESGMRTDKKLFEKLESEKGYLLRIFMIYMIIGSISNINWLIVLQVFVLGRTPRLINNPSVIRSFENINGTVQSVIFKRCLADNRCTFFYFKSCVFNHSRNIDLFIVICCCFSIFSKEPHC